MTQDRKLAERAIMAARIAVIEAISDHRRPHPEELVRLARIAALAKAVAGLPR